MIGDGWYFLGRSDNCLPEIDNMPTCFNGSGRHVADTYWNLSIGCGVGMIHAILHAPHDIHVNLSADTSMSISQSIQGIEMKPRSTVTQGVS